jgi:hypothetical protein
MVIFFSPTAPSPAPTAAPTDPALASGAHYVAKAGSDDSPGTAQAPWRTIQKAADTVQAGDTVYIRGGTYNERVLLKASGSSGAYITFASYPGESVILDGTGIALAQNRNALFDTNGRSYIVIDQIRIIHSDYFGIGDMAGETNNGHDIIVRNCSTYDTGSSGIAFFWGSRITVSNNVVEYSNTNGAQEAISLHGIQGFTINGNEVFDGLKEGIDAKGGSSNGKIYDNYVHDLLGGEWDMNGIYLDAWDRYQTNIEVYNNLVERCGNGIIVGAENNGHLDGVNIHHNTIRYCRAGFNVSGWGIGSTHMVENVVFDHNTIIGSADNGITFSNASARNIRLTNNTLGGRYSISDPIEMTNGVTAVDASVFIDGNALNRLATGSSYLTGTNYTLLAKAPTPTGVSVSSTAAGKATVTWNAVSGATAYEVFRSTDSNGTGYYRRLGAVTTASFTDEGLAAGTYWYKVVANNGLAASELSDFASIQIDASAA